MVRPTPGFKGKLFVVEGIDGSGKSTQIDLLHKWVFAQGYSTFFSEWNSSPLVKRTTKRGKNRRLLTPLTFSLIHATDFADRTERNIIPPLRAGAAVMADRYIYTAFARDVARGCDPQWVRDIQLRGRTYRCEATSACPRSRLGRILTGRPELKWHARPGSTWGSRMIPTSPSNSSRHISSSSMMRWWTSSGCRSSTAHCPSPSSSARCATSSSHISRACCVAPTTSSASTGRRVSDDGSAHGSGSYSGLADEVLPGKLIVLEGTDGVGRSTQMNLLRNWLESSGLAVYDTGLSRGRLAGDDIQRRRVESTMTAHPGALRHRFRRPPGARDHSTHARRYVVLTDRYIYTLMARHCARHGA